MAIHKIELYRDDEGRTVESRSNLETGEVTFFAHFKDVVYYTEPELTANCLVDMQAKTLDFAFQTFAEKRQAKQNQLTLSFLEFLEQNPERKAALEQAAASKRKSRLAATGPIGGDRHVTSPETANVGKAPAIFRAG